MPARTCVQSQIDRQGCQCSYFAHDCDDRLEWEELTPRNAVLVEKHQPRGTPTHAAPVPSGEITL